MQSQRAFLLARLCDPLLAVIFPIVVLVLWHFATYGRKYSLIPPPTDVAPSLYDLAFGGIYDDAYSRTLHIHLLASLSRVYGGFTIAALLAVPLGLMIGRISIVRRLLDPTLQVLRPIPVTAWLPLSMIIFGLGPRSAFFLVCLGSFYPILINTIFGVRSVDQRAFRGGKHTRLSEHGTILQSCAPGQPACHFHRPAAWSWFRVGGHRGRGNNRRTDRARRDYHGGTPALAHGDCDLRNGRDWCRRLHFFAMESELLKHLIRFSNCAA